MRRRRRRRRKMRRRRRRRRKKRRRRRRRRRRTRRTKKDEDEEKEEESETTTRCQDFSHPCVWVSRLHFTESSFATCSVQLGLSSSPEEAQTLHRARSRSKVETVGRADSTVTLELPESIQSSRPQEHRRKVVLEGFLTPPLF